MPNPPPRILPATSNEALIVNTVSRVGTDTSAVRNICRNLNPFECSGSMNR